MGTKKCLLLNIYPNLKNFNYFDKRSSPFFAYTEPSYTIANFAGYQPINQHSDLVVLYLPFGTEIFHFAEKVTSVWNLTCPFEIPLAGAGCPYKNFAFKLNDVVKGYHIYLPEQLRNILVNYNYTYNIGSFPTLRPNGAIFTSQTATEYHPDLKFENLPEQYRCLFKETLITFP